MSKKWQPPQISRTQPISAQVDAVLSGPVLPPPRFKSELKSFSSRLQEGVTIPWTDQMDTYIAHFMRDTGATLHSVHPSEVQSNVLFIWELPCP